jgi:hypothetical protein
MALSMLGLTGSAVDVVGIPAEPCCSVVSINKRTLTVRVSETGTSCTYEFQVKNAKDLEGLEAGKAIAVDLKALMVKAEPVNGTRTLTGTRPAEPVGRPAEPAGKPTGTTKAPESGTRSVAATASAACGSNVDRNAKTKTLCKVMTGPNSWYYRPC